MITAARGLAALALMLVSLLPVPAWAQASGQGEVLEKNIPIAVTEVAPGLYFMYHLSLIHI